MSSTQEVNEFSYKSWIWLEKEAEVVINDLKSCTSCLLIQDGTSGTRNMLIFDTDEYSE